MEERMESENLKLVYLLLWVATLASLAGRDSVSESSDAVSQRVTG